MLPAPPTLSPDGLPPGLGIDTGLPPRDLEFFGAIADIPETIVWNGQRKTVLFHITTTAEEQDIVTRTARLPEEQHLIAELELRMAYAVRAVDGRPVTFGQPLYQEDDTLVEEEYAARLAWVGRWPSTLLDAICVAYGVASLLPRTLLSELQRDPNTDAGPATNGLSFASPATSDAAGG